MMLAALSLSVISCDDDDDPKLPVGNDVSTGSSNVTIGSVNVTITGITRNLAGLEVRMRNTATETVFTATTNTNGMAEFKVAPGIYEVSASMTITTDEYKYIYNGSKGQVTIVSGQNDNIELEITETKVRLVVGEGTLVIKELYNGGCQKDDGSGFFQADKCVILYNNSANPVKAANLCFAIISPYNSQADNKWYDEGGKLIYADDNYLPALDGIWYFPDTLRVNPYQQVVVNCQGAINNIKTYSQSVNYANKDYYCMYDPEIGYNNKSYYPTPADVIPTSHYLKAVKIGISNAWALSITSPALVLFQTKDVSLTDYMANADNMIYTPGAAQNDINKNLKVRREWIIDGIEVYTSTSNDNVKRLTADVDAGYVTLTNKQGHVLYRNIDQKATEALVENSGKLVYNYSLGVENSTDPSGIDAEASMKNGAHIVFQDTNNSTADFHERLKCSLRN